MTEIDIWRGRLVRRWNYGKQWLHRCRKNFAWMRARSDFEKGVPRSLQDHQWVFLVGCNNSGTTLIHDVLAATGKFSFMPHEGQRYTNVLRRADKKGHERVWTEYLDELRLDESDPVQDVSRLLFDWLQEIDKPVKGKILEKTTANAVRMRWLQSAFPNSAFIGVVRNGYAVVEGIKRKGRKPIDRGARHWNRVNEIMLEDAKHIRQFLLISYEGFVTSPQKTLPELASFLGLTNTELERAFSQVSIRNMNADSLRRLNETERRTIDQEAGGLIRKLGYTLGQEVI